MSLARGHFGSRMRQGKENKTIAGSSKLLCVLLLALTCLLMSRPSSSSAAPWKDQFYSSQDWKDYETQFTVNCTSYSPDAASDAAYDRAWDAGREARSSMVSSDWSFLLDEFPDDQDFPVDFDST